MTQSMHPLVTLMFIALLLAIAILVWALRELAKRTTALEGATTVHTAVPVVETADDISGVISIDDEVYLDLGRIDVGGRVVRAHIPPAPLPAAAHVGGRLDVTL